VENLNLPPHSIEAEQAVLAALIANKSAFDSIHHLKSICFYRNSHAEIFTAFLEMLENKKAIDVLTISEYLESKGKLEQIGGWQFIAEITNNNAAFGNVKRYAEIVQEKFILRQLLVAIHDIQSDIYAHGDVDKKLDRAQSSIMAITERTQTSEPVFVYDLLAERMERIDAVYMGDVKSISTGLTDLDTKLGGGFEGGQLVIIAARPAMGKSALAVQLAENIQNKENAGVIFSCEMPNGQIVDRIISSHGRISSDKLRTGKFEDEDFHRLTASVPSIQKLNLLVDDKSSNLNAIASKARNVKRKHGLSVIVVDYLQLLEGAGDIREQQIANISRGLKKLAIELNIPVIALSQLNRNLESRANRRPMMSDLRESGAIEQDADVIIGIYRDEEYNPDTQYKGIAELIILKNRSGTTGTVATTFIGQYTRFEDFTGSYEPNKSNVEPIQKRGYGG